MLCVPVVLADLLLREERNRKVTKVKPPEVLLVVSVLALNVKALIIISV